jgi:hypothetical protein
LLVGVAAALTFGLMAAWPPLRSVETGATPEYPQLRPADYRFSRDRVFAGVLEVAATFPDVAITATEASSGTVHLTWRGPVGALDSTVLVRVEQNGEAGAIVFVESTLVRGRADFGQNARVIRRLLAGLDDNLSLARPEGT